MEFNGDHFIGEEFLKLKADWDIKSVVETGTYLGETSEWLASHFEFTHTIEIDTKNEVRLKALQAKYPSRLLMHRGSSQDVLKRLVPALAQRTLFFLDAHWEDYWPLLDELKEIRNCKIKPVIAIHDFKCHDFGFDSYKGVALDFDYVKAGIEGIYGSDYVFYTNSPGRITGCWRGVGYFIPGSK